MLDKVKKYSVGMRKKFSSICLEVLSTGENGLRSKRGKDDGKGGDGVKIKNSVKNEKGGKNE